MKLNLFRKRYGGVHLVFFLSVLGVVGMVIQSYRNVTALGQQLESAIHPIVEKTSAVDTFIRKDRELEKKVLSDEVQILRAFVDSMQHTLHDEVQLLRAFNTLTTVPMLLLFFIGIEAFRHDKHLKAQQALAEKESQLKSQFFSLVTHELKTPMTSILALSKLLSRTELSPQQLKDLNCIQSAGQEQLELIHQILDYSKLEAGQMSLDLQPFQLDSLLDQLHGLTRPLLRSKEVQLKFNNRASSTMVVSDEGHLSSVLKNLLSNACRHTDKGSIELSCQRDPNQQEVLLFCVADTGKGIPEEELPKLGNPFHQVHGRDQGTGLGLTMVKRLIALVGGSIKMESQVGLGTKVSFTWPLSSTHGRVSA